MKQLIIVFLTTFTLLFKVQCFELDTLELVVALFRHGDRTKDVSSTYPSDPHINVTYEPYGTGELTNEGKLRSFHLGKQLKEKYSNYLSKIYTYNSGISAVSTNFNRTKTTLKYVLDGLFHANTNSIKSIVDFKIFSVRNSSLMFPFHFCPRYRQIHDEYESFGEGRKLKDKYVSNFSYISHHIGTNITKLYDLLTLYECLHSEEEWNLKLPKWTSLVYKSYLKSASKDFYTISVALPELNKRFGGLFLKDMLTHFDMKRTTSKGYMLELYSAHDMNIVAVLGALEMYHPHMIPYLACVLIELHKIRDSYYIKILYQKNVNSGFKDMILPNCSVLCPIEKFKTIVAPNIPNHDDNCDIKETNWFQKNM